MRLKSYSFTTLKCWFNKSDVWNEWKHIMGAARIGPTLNCAEKIKKKLKKNVLPFYSSRDLISSCVCGTGDCVRTTTMYTHSAYSTYSVYTSKNSSWPKRPATKLKSVTNGLLRNNTNNIMLNHTGAGAKEPIIRVNKRSPDPRHKYVYENCLSTNACTYYYTRRLGTLCA